MGNAVLIIYFPFFYEPLLIIKIFEIDLSGYLNGLVVELFRTKFYASLNQTLSYPFSSVLLFGYDSAYS